MLRRKHNTGLRTADCAAAAASSAAQLMPPSPPMPPPPPPPPPSATGAGAAAAATPHDVGAPADRLTRPAGAAASLLVQPCPLTDAPKTLLPGAQSRRVQGHPTQPPPPRPAYPHSPPPRPSSATRWPPRAARPF
ncbi:hypothetical protein I4F81_001731 [Pyropia yezoensis]|uniref:Uncharacterized protein n=1 Tax=Pyropia yezoensis TaxID=2788 RepID=A0ACC3BN21_PYRYE|nr:hypothetical protein I4F81_001731 [Neopyropia yezoensis]